MRFIEWFPYYQEIRQQFHYSTEKDQEAAYLLSRLIKRKALDLKTIENKIVGRRIIVIGAGLGLGSNINFIKKDRKTVKIAADDTVRALIENKIRPDIVLTDLDGDISFLRKADKMGSIMVVHAHGDNIDALKRMVPTFRHVIGSTQVMPVNNVYNFGGFTDGDRCVFLADELGAKEIIMVGMDLSDHIGKYSKTPIEDFELKKQKLKKAKTLLQMLAKHSKSMLFDTSEKPVKGFAHFFDSQG